MRIALRLWHLALLILFANTTACPFATVAAPAYNETIMYVYKGAGQTNRHPSDGGQWSHITHHPVTQSLSHTSPSHPVTQSHVTQSHSHTSHRSLSAGGRRRWRPHTPLSRTTRHHTSSLSLSVRHSYFILVNHSHTIPAHTFTHRRHANSLPLDYRSIPHITPSLSLLGCNRRGGRSRLRWGRGPVRTTCLGAGPWRTP